MLNPTDIHITVQYCSGVGLFTVSSFVDSRNIMVNGETHRMLMFRP